MGKHLVPFWLLAADLDVAQCTAAAASALQFRRVAQITVIDRAGRFAREPDGAS